MDKDKILVEAKAELERHVWGTFVDGKATVALGGMGVIVSGCEACRKQFGTNSQYLRHLSDDVLPIILRKAFEIAGATVSRGIEGYGASTLIHRSHLLSFSSDAPLMVSVIDSEDKVQKLLPFLDEMVARRPDRHVRSRSDQIRSPGRARS